jgi:hypothetical protein
MAANKGRTDGVNARALRAALECDLEPLKQVARDLVETVLEDAADRKTGGRGQIGEAAAALGVGRRTIERMIETGQVCAANGKQTVGGRRK